MKRFAWEYPDSRPIRTQLASAAGRGAAKTVRCQGI